MNGFIQPGDVVEFTAPGGGVVAGTGKLIGKLLVIPMVTAAAAARFNGLIAGVVSHAKTNAQAWAEGDRIYWDAGNSRFDNVATVGPFAGIAVVAAANPSATGIVRLNQGAPLVDAGVAGVAGGYKIARGQAVTATASDTIATGLATVVAAVANLEDNPVIGCDRAQGVIGDQAGAPVAGSILVKTFKPTAAGDATPIAATTFGKKVNWIAIGT